MRMWMRVVMVFVGTVRVLTMTVFVFTVFVHLGLLALMRLGL